MPVCCKETAYALLITAEIDKTTKKIEEGIAAYDDLFDEVRCMAGEAAQQTRWFAPNCRRMPLTAASAAENGEADIYLTTSDAIVVLAASSESQQHASRAAAAATDCRVNQFSMTRGTHQRSHHDAPGSAH